MTTTTFFCSMLLLTSPVDVSGQVVNEQGQGVAGAIVAISSAKPKTGPILVCPTCYADCAKRVQADADGKFTISGLSSDLLFSLKSGAPGYHGTVSELIDPTAHSPIKLQISTLLSGEGQALLRGTVVDMSGQPVVGAEVRSKSIRSHGAPLASHDPTVTPITLSGLDGTFEMAAGEKVVSLDVRVVAAGYAPFEFNWQRSNKSPVTVRLGAGASLRGTAVLDGRPIAGVELEMVQADRSIGYLVTPASVFTDQYGVFNFDNLPPNTDYMLYSMIGQDAAGILPISRVSLPNHGERANLGEVKFAAPQGMKITVETEDGSKLPEKSSLSVWRMEAWRGYSRKLPAEPSVDTVIKDLGPDQYHITLRTPGYQVVKTTPLMGLDVNQAYLVQPSNVSEVKFVVRAKKPGN